MITLKTAMSLCRIEDSEGVYLRQKGGSIWTAHWMTGKEIRNKLDTQAIKVTRIAPYFDYGEYDGLEFEVTGL